MSCNAHPNRNPVRYQQRYNEFQRLGGTIPLGPTHNVCRGALANYRRFNENQIDAVENVLAQTTRDLAARTQAIADAQGAARPQTSDTILGERQTHVLEHTTMPPPSVNQFAPITLRFANDLVNTHARTGTHNGIGCAISNNAPDRASGYVKINLRNTVIGGTRINFQPYLHQLVLVGAGRKDELLATLREPNDPEKPDLEISHLCHNGGCCNAAHLIVESHADNIARNTCRGHHIIQHGRMTYHPCPHRQLAARQQCILSTLGISDGYHINPGH